MLSVYAGLRTSSRRKEKRGEDREHVGEISPLTRSIKVRQIRRRHALTNTIVQEVKKKKRSKYGPLRRAGAGGGFVKKNGTDSAFSKQAAQKKPPCRRPPLTGKGPVSGRILVGGGGEKKPTFKKGRRAFHARSMKGSSSCSRKFRKRHPIEQKKGIQQKKKGMGARQKVAFGRKNGLYKRASEPLRIGN